MCVCVCQPRDHTMRRKLNRTEETSQIDWYNAKGIPKAEAKTLLYIDTMENNN